MPNRYALRFESGERSGESIPITGAVFTIGRKPGNSLQILENSVSGKHAELVIEDAGVLLKDLGSTNGTRVGADRVLETRLTPGATVSFGNVLLTFVDAETVSGPSDRGTPTAPRASISGDDPGDDGQELHIDAADIARAGKSSKLGVLLLLVLAAAGGGIWWWLRNGGGGEKRVRIRPVEELAGNLLAAGYSFEDDSSSWSAEEAAPAAFLSNSGARHSGARGIRVELEAASSGSAESPGTAADWAQHSSPWVRVNSEKHLVGSAQLRTIGGAHAQLGIELRASGSPQAATIVAVTTQVSPDEFQPVELTCVVPSGCDEARAFILAARSSSGGVDELQSVDADDVALIAGAAASPTASLDAYRLYSFGAPSCSSSILRITEVVFSRMAATGQVSASESSRGLELPYAAQAVQNGFEFQLDSGARVLRLRAEAAGHGGQIATTGERYATHSGTFQDVSGVTGVLLGMGNDLVGLAFEGPVTFSGRQDGDAYELTFRLGENRSLLVQTRFREERNAAGDLAAQADDAERRGELGECIRLWRELLDNYPFERSLVDRAESTQGRLIRSGLDETLVLEGEVERARFFRLVDLYRQCANQAEETATRYEGSEVEDRVRTLLANINEDLGSLEADLDRHERMRLQGILASLDAQGATQLAESVRSYLREQFEGER